MCHLMLSSSSFSSTYSSYYAGPPTVLSFTLSLGCLLNVEAVNLTCVVDGLPRPDVVFLKGAGTPFTCGVGSSCNISNGVITFFQVQSGPSRVDCQPLSSSCTRCLDSLKTAV